MNTSTPSSTHALAKVSRNAGGASGSISCSWQWMLINTQSAWRLASLTHFRMSAVSVVSGTEETANSSPLLKMRR